MSSTNVRMHLHDDVVRILVQNISNMELRQKCSKAWFYFTSKDSVTNENMDKHFSPKHVSNLHECNVFDTLPSDVGDSQSGT